MRPALMGGEPIRKAPFPPWPEFGKAEEEGLRQVLQSRAWGGYSEKARQFEEAFAALHCLERGISCANGTVAIEVVLRALGITSGDEVIVPPFTFVATASAVLLCHAWPVFVDIEPDTLNLSPPAVEAAITPRTKAIIAVHFGGHPADLDSLTTLAKRRGIYLIEDAAHAHGALRRGLPVGNFGAAATVGFQAFKLVTSGEGGIILTNSGQVADACRNYCNQGRREGGGLV